MIIEASKFRFIIVFVLFIGFLPYFLESQNISKAYRKPIIIIVLVLMIVGMKMTEFSLNNALLKAAESGNLEEVQQLLNSGAYVNTVDENEWTPLVYAARHNPDPDVLKLLIDEGAKIAVYPREKDNNAVDHFIRLFFKPSKNYMDVSMFLGEKGLNFRIVFKSGNAHALDKFGITSLMLAAGNNSNPDVLKYLYR
jgi:ankyrin repeat protein